MEKCFIFFYNIAQINIKKEIFCVDIELHVIVYQHGFSQSAYKIYKCYIINSINIPFFKADVKQHRNEFTNILFIEKKNGRYNTH